MSETTANFEQATRLAYRYQVPGIGGSVTTEDLWDLTLKQLDATAIKLNEELEQAGKKSFLTDTPKVNAAGKSKLDIIVHIIRVRQAEAEASQKRKETEARRKQVLELLAKKQEDKDAGKTEAELLAELEAINNQL